MWLLFVIEDLSVSHGLTLSNRLLESLLPPPTILKPPPLLVDDDLGPPHGSSAIRLGDAGRATGAVASRDAPPGGVVSDRVVLHADMDAFYAAVEQRDHPELRGRPVIVGGTGPRGVVSTCSYEAREFGVRSAMPAFEARRLCPEGVFVRGSMRRYASESKRIFEVFRRFTPLVQGISLDEAFLDISGTERLFGPPRKLAERLRAEVRSETGLAVSVGIAPVKLVAKIASDLAKPDGLLEIAPEAVPSFLAPLPVRRLWGVGPVAGERLVGAGYATIGASGTIIVP